VTEKKIIKLSFASGFEIDYAPRQYGWCSVCPTEALLDGGHPRTRTNTGESYELKTGWLLFSLKSLLSSFLL